MLKLIDISHWETVSSWETLKTQVDGVYTKATQGLSFVDPKLDEFIKGANSVGLPIGVYHVIQCGQPIEAQLAHFKDAINSKTPIKSQLRCALDFETEVNKGFSVKENKQACVSFLTLMATRLGYKPLFYCNSGDLHDFQFTPAEAQGFDMWLANYNASSLPSSVAGVTKYLMWQHTDKLNVPGVGPVDHNYLYGTMSDLLITQATPTPPAATAPEPIIVKPTGAVTDRLKLIALAQSIGRDFSAMARITHMLDVRDFQFPQSKPRYWAEIDMRLKSSEKRMIIYDIESMVTLRIPVAHGKGSDLNNDGFLDSFSNVPGSEATSQGVSRVAEAYTGKHGLSARIDGLEMTNDKMRFRSVVLHGAAYVEDAYIRDNGHAGRSDGCFAVSDSNHAIVVSKLTTGSFIVCHRG